MASELRLSEGFTNAEGLIYFIEDLNIVRG